MKPYRVANIPTTVPRALKTPTTNPNINISRRRLLLVNISFTLYKNGSFFIVADPLGGVNGLSLKNKTIKIVTIIARIAWRQRE